MTSEMTHVPDVPLQAFGRPVRNMKKFEEGVFSDLRNLKPGVDACLEEPKVISHSFPKKKKNTQTRQTEPVPRSLIQVPMHPHPKKAKSLLLVGANSQRPIIIDD